MHFAYNVITNENDEISYFDSNGNGVLSLAEVTRVSTTQPPHLNVKSKINPHFREFVMYSLSVNSLMPSLQST